MFVTSFQHRCRLFVAVSSVLEFVEVCWVTETKRTLQSPFWINHNNMSVELLDCDVGDNPCIFLPLEESCKLTEEQAIYRGEFVPTVKSARPESALMVLLPVAASRVRFVAFDLVVDSHDGSDIETAP